MSYIAIFFLPLAYALSYPIEWVIDHTFTPFAFWVSRKRVEWDSAYRD